MEMKKGDRQSRKDKSQSMSGEKLPNDSASVKKERSFVRNSYNNHYANGGSPNNNYAEKKVLVTRQRSFIRSSSFSQEQDYDIHRSHRGISRQRSFISPSHNGEIYKIQNQQQRRKSSASTSHNHRVKPAMEIYRPPTMRGPGIYENGDMYNGNRPGLNINAKEFISMQSQLQHSKSSSSVPHQGKYNGLQHSKSGGNLLRGSSTNHNDHYMNGGDSPPRVHFSDDKENEPQLKAGMVPRPPSLSLGGPENSIKRSKSLSAADMMRHHQVHDSATTPSMPDLGPFSPDVQSSISKTLNDPNSVSARQVMEVVRHIFTRLIEATRYAEPAARICISIVEKEKGETFLETLLNTCQEYFQERDRLLRNSAPAPYPGYTPSHPRWIAYMTFLNEMYTQLKRRHVQLMNRRMKNSDTAPGLLLLTLLAQCCHVCLREPAVNSLAETECLFFVLTGVGKDIELEIGHHMSRVMTAARDAFLTTVRVPAVRKTLLQLIEMHAARWQLPAPAVMYYYPGSSGK